MVLGRPRVAGGEHVQSEMEVLGVSPASSISETGTRLVKIWLLEMLHDTEQVRLEMPYCHLNIL